MWCFGLDWDTVTFKGQRLGHFWKRLRREHFLRAKRRLLVVVEGPQSALWDVRFGQYASHFAKSDYAVDSIARTTAFPIRRFGSALQRGVDRCIFGPVYRSIVRRQESRILELANSADLVYLLGVPSPALHRQLCDRPALKMIMDVVDSLWLPYHRQFGWEQFSRMASTADAVTCKSEGIADHVRNVNNNTFIVPDSPQLSAFDAHRERVNRDPSIISLGWLGSPDSSPTLNLLHGVLEQLATDHPNLMLTILGGDPARVTKYEKMKCRLIPRYNRDQMVQELLAIDVGLYPQFDDEDAQTRGASKARLYMSAGAVALCQQIGESAAMIQDGVDGVLAATEEDWLEKLKWLINDRQRISEIGQRGLELVRKDYSLDCCFERLMTAFESV